MATPFQLELVTPERVLFSGEVDEISMRTDGGEIAFLAHHEDYVGAVAITVARLSLVSADGATSESETGTLLAAVHGGFVHVDRERVTILAGVAELGDEIDVDRARRALATAQERLVAEGPATLPGRRDEAEGEPGASESLSGAMVALLAPESAEAAVARATVRLEAAGATSSSN
jgi:F-type H+-transporting ATPase subunit epsilon